MMFDADVMDDVLLTKFRYCAHEQKLYRQFSQPDRALILERNKRLRNNPDALNDLSFGQQALSIPVVDYEELKVKYPVLEYGDAEQRNAFYKRFIKSAESLPYRVR